MSKTTEETTVTATATQPIPGYQAGSSKVHALKRTGTYPSGSPRYEKRCGTSRTDRYLPSPAAEGTPITCKHCLAKLAG